MSFIKHDQGKPDMSYLVDFKEELKQVCMVLDYGSRKYSRDNWKKGTNRRYISAAGRHLLDYDSCDSDTGLPHLAHCISNMLFLLKFYNEGKVDGPDQSEDVGGRHEPVAKPVTRVPCRSQRVDVYGQRYDNGLQNTFGQGNRPLPASGGELN